VPVSTQINDVHYMATTPASLLPVHLTPFAHDKAFGFETSNLKDWVNGKEGIEGARGIRQEECMSEGGREMKEGRAARILTPSLFIYLKGGAKAVRASAGQRCSCHHAR